MHRILTLLGFLLPGLLNAQPFSWDEVFGTSVTGGLYGSGGMIMMGDFSSANIPFYRETCYPLTSFKLFQGKIYGMAGSNGNDQHFDPENGKLFVSTGTDQALKSLGDRVTFPISWDDGLMGPAAGFSAAQNMILCLNEGKELKIIQASTLKQLHKVSFTTSATSYCTPVLYNGKAYFGINDAAEASFYSYELATKTLKSLFTTSTADFMGVIGEPVIVEDKLYITVQCKPGSDAIQKMIEFDTNTESLREVYKFDTQSGYNSFGNFAQSNLYFYNTASQGGEGKSGVIYRLDPSTAQVEVLLHFTPEQGKPFGNVVNVNGKIYGLSQLINKDISLFQYDPFTVQLEEILRYTNTGNGFKATGLLNYYDQLIVVGARAGSNETGALYTVDVENRDQKSFEGYTFRYAGMGLDKPAFYDKTFYGAVDSTIYAINAYTQKLQYFTIIPVSSKIHSLSGSRGRLYGISRSTASGKMVFYSVDVNSGSFTVHSELDEQRGSNLEMIPLEEKLYFFDHSSTPSVVIFNTISGTIEKFSIPLINCEVPVGSLCKVEGDFYFTTAADTSCADTAKGRILKFNLQDQSFQEVSDFSSFEGHTGNNNLIYAGGKLLSAFIKPNDNFIYSFDPITKELKSEYHTYDYFAIRFPGNFINVGNTIHTRFELKEPNQVDDSFDHAIFSMYAPDGSCGWRVDTTVDYNSTMKGCEMINTKSPFSVYLSTEEVHENETSWNVFPSPATSFIQFESKATIHQTAPVNIYSIEGKLMYTGKTSDKPSVTEWPAGVYSVIIGDRLEGMEVKLVVSH